MFSGFGPPLYLQGRLEVCLNSRKWRSAVELPTQPDSHFPRQLWGSCCIAVMQEVVTYLFVKKVIPGATQRRDETIGPRDQSWDRSGPDFRVPHFLGACGLCWPRGWRDITFLRVFPHNWCVFCWVGGFLRHFWFIPLWKWNAAHFTASLKIYTVFWWI